MVQSVPRRQTGTLSGWPGPVQQSYPTVAVAEAVIESHPAGYRLVIDPEDVDVTRFERLVADGRATLPNDPAKAARTLRDPLRLWRGPALLDVAGVDFFQPAIAHPDDSS